MTALTKFIAEARSRLDAATPRPWFVAEMPFDDRSTAVYGDNTAQVACDPHGARFITDCDVTMEWTEGEPDSSIIDRANAQLIANAPTDLERALKIIEVQAEYIKGNCECYLNIVSREDCACGVLDKVEQILKEGAE